MRVVRWCAGAAVVATTHTALNAWLLRSPPTQPTPAQARVAVLLPVRDEANRIAACVRALLAQRSVPHLEIVILDDGSVDGSAELIDEVVAGDPRVRVLTGRPIPDGWLGKPHACQQLADAAGDTPDILVFVDADVVVEPDTVATAVECLLRTGLDLVSPYPRQVAVGPASRLVQPLLQWSWLTFLPLRMAEHSRRPSLAAANGQFLVVRRSTYARAGGHGAVRTQVIEDIALARAIRAVGGSGGIVDGTALATCTMYDDWAGLSAGYEKSLWTAFGSPAGAAAAVGVLGAIYVVPPLAALRGSRAGVVGYLAGVAGRVIAARRTGGRLWPDALAHPASVALLGWLTVQSVRGHRHGSLTWKGRALR